MTQGGFSLDGNDEADEYEFSDARPVGNPMKLSSPETTATDGISMSSLGGMPSLGGGRRFGGLGGVQGRAGGFDVDEAALKRANAELAKLNKITDISDDLLGNEQEEEKKLVSAGRSMMQIMDDKRKRSEATQAKNHQQSSGEESV